jgi:large conductance mechanosensitive channel
MSNPAAGGPDGEEETMLKEFKEFAIKGNVMDMAVGIVVGAAFGAIVKSLVDDVIMPPIGLLLGNVDFQNLFIVLKEGGTPGPYPNLAAASNAGAVVLRYGVFFNSIVSFVIVAFAIFMVIKQINRLKREAPAPVAAPTTEKCPQCRFEIPIGAKKCGFCTTTL